MFELNSLNYGDPNQGTPSVKREDQSLKKHRETKYPTLVSMSGALGGLPGNNTDVNTGVNLDQVYLRQAEHFIKIGNPLKGLAYLNRFDSTLPLQKNLDS